MINTKMWGEMLQRLAALEARVERLEAVVFPTVDPIPVKREGAHEPVRERTGAPRRN